MRKLGLVCQERVHGRQNCFRQIVADRHNNNKINKKYLATQWEMTKQPLNSITTAILNVFVAEGKEHNKS